MTGRFRMVCSKCGSEDVSRDAWASWNVDRQEWETSSVFDEAFCHDCETETSIEKELIEETPEHTCKFCGSPSSIDPSDQAAPADYCHPSDHGSSDA